MQSSSTTGESHEGRVPIRVLVVDDSPFMRKAISRMLDADPLLSVVGTAGDGIECLQRVEELRPDVITLDIVMPRMDGMTALKQIMERYPVPVIVLSSLAGEGAEVSLIALGLGAVDVVEKPATLTNMDVFKIAPELTEKVKGAASVDGPTLARLAGHESAAPCAVEGDGAVSAEDVGACEVDCVVVGASTGGPAALHRIIARIAAEASVPVVMVQHMPEGFTGALAERLKRVAKIEVKEAADGDLVQGGRVLIARAGMHLRFERRRDAVVVRLNRVPSDVAHVPSIDVTMHSAAVAFGSRALGVLLTGMGSDGAMGLLEMAQAGAPTIAEASSSAVIFGMPRVAAEIGAAAEVLDLADICARVQSITCPSKPLRPSGEMVR